MKSLTENIDVLDINVKFKDVQKLEYQSESALNGQRKLMFFEFVPAEINYNQNIYQVKLRLKGDRPIHYADKDKWSFRIKVKEDKTLFNMKEFSVQKPVTRNYIYEWIFHKMLEKEGILSLRYKFVKVIFNGKDLGVYALEEHFDKYLIESNMRRDGPIIRFDETYGNSENLSEAPIVPFNSSQWSQPDGIILVDKAVNLLEAFRLGKLKTSQVFDVEKLAKFFAITDLLGTQHAALWKSMRFYYNPITSRLEPIGFDGQHGNLSDTEIKENLLTSTFALDENSYFSNYREWFKLLFNDPSNFDRVFFEKYIQTLERITNEKYLNNFFKDVGEELERNLILLHMDAPLGVARINSSGPDLFKFTKDGFYKIQYFIKELFHQFPERVHAYIYKLSSNKISVEVGNFEVFPIEILNLSYSSKGELVNLFPNEKNIIFPKKLSAVPSEVPDYKIIEFNFADRNTINNNTIMKISYKILGAKEVKTVEIYPWLRIEKKTVTDDLVRSKPNFGKFKFLDIREAEKLINIKPGSWIVDHNLIFPEGYKIVCGRGTKLNLSNSAVILSYSPFQFVGEKESPIEIYSSDAKGQGIVIMNAGEESLFKYVLFKNLSNPTHNGWELTGAVTFYNSPVTFSNCRFVESRSEDALNLVRSAFNIENTVFSNTQADAIDSDFSKGRIINTSFYEPGNDAIDISGTVINLENIYIVKPGDKGVSAGEKSFVSGKNIKVDGGELAFASKDLSKMKINGVEINSCKVGFTAYQKKPEYGPSSIEADNVAMANVGAPYLIEKKSTVIIEGKIIEPNENKIKDMLYGVQYGKSSK
ncbi:MAG: CotH kinase family protein [Ignavibacteriales bacterium]|nr:CotH kinase family protein [Ignavibacteriales bacterium]